jgi:hypothetical protein
MDEEQRRVHAASIQLRELLNEQCPRCGAAFLDFNGCCALTCHRCNCGFCAWCLKDCGADAHTHVARCDLNLEPGHGVFSSERLVEEGRRARRHGAAVTFLSGLTKEVAAEVSAAVSQELNDVGLVELVALFKL